MGEMNASINVFFPLSLSGLQVFLSNDVVQR